MEREAKKAILRNRARLLNLDYFDLTAPLLASEVLPTRKHKEIKTDATTGKARVDLLLEWLDESAPKDAFASFLQGIRNCKDLILAKKIKREAAGEVSHPTTTVVKVETPKIAKTSGNAAAPKIKLQKKIKKEKVEPAVNAGSALLNGDFFVNLVTPTTSAGKKKTPADKKKATPKVNGSQKSLDLSKGTKVLGPKSAPTATPRSTRKSSVMTNTSLNEKLEGAADSSAKKRKAPAAKATPAKKAKAADNVKAEPAKSRAKGEAAAKAMTFAEVEKKQEDFRQKFKFRNADATVKTIHYNDKSDIFYQGCPTEMTKKICSKKVDLKGREYVCEGKHHNTTYIHIPRLYVTFNDGTGDMQLTLFKKNVEIFSGKPTSDLDNMSDTEIKNVLEKSMAKKMNVEVQCDKVKKLDAKKAGGAKWNNVATILSDDQAKGGKKRKN